MSNLNDSNSEDLYRVHKIIAKRGYCSTRKAEDLIKLGKVTIDDNVVELGQKAPLDSEIKINGKILKNESSKDVTYILNKPIGYECSRKTFKNLNKTIFSLLPHNARLISVGRLDVKTSGLLILTTNGKLAQEIIHPSKDLIKSYLIRIHIKLEEEDKQLLLTQGIKIENSYSKAKYIRFIGTKKGSFEYEVGVSEGKKHIVRKLFGDLGYVVKSLQRIKIGNLDLFKLNIKEGEYKEMREDLILKLIR